jgi:hypothetical protein
MWSNWWTYPCFKRCDPWDSTFNLQLNKFISNLVSNVIKSPSNPIILKLSWLKICNPNIDWLVRKFYSRINCHPKKKSIQSIFIRMCKFLLQATRNGTPITVYATPTKSFENKNALKTKSFQELHIIFKINLIKIYHVQACQYFLWRRKMGLFACVWIIVISTKSP